MDNADPGPTTIIPVGPIFDTTPTYKWTAISGATQYQFQVYRGTTKVIDRTFASTYCGAAECTVTPSNTLTYASYTWKVRARGSAWGAFSSARSFSVTAGFSSPFTSSTSGWASVYGTWSLVTTSPGVYKTSGSTNLLTSAAYKTSYSRLDYQVSIKRVGCRSCSSYLEIRGTPSPLRAGDKAWYKSYRFQITNSGFFSVYKINGSTDTALKAWTATSYINSDLWNTLRVTASGSTLKFYINGHLMWTGTDTSFASGKVGLGMFKDDSSGNVLSVDWAKLTTTVSASASDWLEPLAGSGETYPAWAEMNTAPR